MTRRAENAGSASRLTFADTLPQPLHPVDAQPESGRCDPADQPAGRAGEATVDGPLQVQDAEHLRVRLVMPVAGETRVYAQLACELPLEPDHLSLQRVVTLQRVMHRDVHVDPVGRAGRSTGWEEVRQQRPLRVRQPPGGEGRQPPPVEQIPEGGGEGVDLCIRAAGQPEDPAERERRPRIGRQPGVQPPYGRRLAEEGGLGQQPPDHPTQPSPGLVRPGGQLLAGLDVGGRPTQPGELHGVDV